jgi:hypothetical protein
MNAFHPMYLGDMAAELMMFRPWKFEWLEAKDSRSPMWSTLCGFVYHILRVLNIFEVTTAILPISSRVSNVTFEEIIQNIAQRPV